MSRGRGPLEQEAPTSPRSLSAQGGGRRGRRPRPPPPLAAWPPGGASRGRRAREGLGPGSRTRSRGGASAGEHRPRQERLLRRRGGERARRRARASSSASAGRRRGGILSRTRCEGEGVPGGRERGGRGETLTWRRGFPPEGRGRAREEGHMGLLRAGTQIPAVCSGVWREEVEGPSFWQSRALGRHAGC